MPTLQVSGTPGTPIYAGRPTPAGGSLLTTLTLVNPKTTEEPAGSVAQMIGHPFVQGHIPAGEWPALELTDGTPVPYTPWGKTTWPDGSLKWLGMLPRLPVAVPASGIDYTSHPLITADLPGIGLLTINIKNGGTAPVSSNRGLDDLTAADLSVVLTGVTNLTGEWTASLNTAITDATDIVSLGDGPAGRIWRIGGPFKQSGSAHGQLHCWHYVAALQNSSGGLLGLRYLGRASQPWADVSSPTPTRRVLTAALKSGSTTLRSLQGHDTTETPGANIGMGHYTSLFTAGTDGKWDFVQGGGSASADCTVRVLHDKTYFVRSRLVPSYDTTIDPANSASVDYYPYGRGPLVRSMNATGERPDIAVISEWHVRHLMTQAAVDERVMRVIGLVSAGWRATARKQSTGQIVPTVAPSATYTGLGTIETAWRGPSNNVSGFQVPTDTTSLWASEYEPSHRPSAAYYPYLVTGEPQFLDLLQEHAATMISHKTAGARTMNVTPPITASTQVASGTGEQSVVIDGVTYNGGGFFFYNGLQRVTAWGSRDIAQAAAISPDVCPFGTEMKKYFTEVITNCHAAVNDYNTKFGADWSASGILGFDVREYSNRPWCSAYLSHSVCHQAAILGTTEAQTLRAYLSQYWANQSDGRDLIHSANFYGLTFDEGSVRITKGGDMMFPLYAVLNFSTSTNGFSISASVTGDADHGTYRASNGDWMAFDSAELTIGADRPFAGVVNYKRYYVVNADRPGNFFQLSETPGGSPVTVTTTGSVERVWARVQDFSPNTFAAGEGNTLESIVAAIRHHKACGDNIDAALTEANAALAAEHPDLTDAPKYAMTSAYPE